MDTRVANSRLQGDVAQVTVDGTGIRTFEARTIARKEGARLLGTADVRIQGAGWVAGNGENEGKVFGFYEVRAY